MALPVSHGAARPCVEDSAAIFANLASGGFFTTETGNPGYIPAQLIQAQRQDYTHSNASEATHVLRPLNN